MNDLTYFQYRAAISEVLEIERILEHPRRRKDTRLILRHMTLCGRIHAYEAARDALERRAA